MAGEKRRLEDRVSRMQRLEAIGTLAGGIAHDFNNILTGLFAYADIVHGLLPPGSPAAPHLDAMTQGFERAADLVRQILTFSRQAPGDAQPLDVAPLVKEAAKLVRASLPPGIKLDLKVPARPFPVSASPVQLHQVVMNLLTNARLALEDGGALTVGLDDAVVGADGEALHLAPGAYVVLDVADTGCGMDAATQARIFEPFFTTRAPGQGTGMGLALVHGIVTGCGGAVAVESEPGRGSVFRVYLPRVAGAPAAAHEAAPVPRGRGERVLLVDDEEQVREAGRLVLESLGYRVRTAAGGAAALALLAADPQACDVLVTDLRMPGMDGFEVAQQARALRADLPVVLTTAFAPGSALAEARAAGVREVVMKPWRGGELGRVLEAVTRKG
jgi:nitrogen-specific signal transduction histidine kinase